jgi:hypothetical protein
MKVCEVLVDPAQAALFSEKPWRCSARPKDIVRAPGRPVVRR